MEIWKLYPVIQFENHRETWDELNDQNTSSPLLESDFVSLLIEYFSDGSEFLAIAYLDNTPVAATIITRRKLLAWQTFQPSQAPIGLWVSSASVSIPVLAHSLSKSLPKVSFIFDITQLDTDHFKRELLEGKCKTVDYIETARITVQGTFDEYWSNRGKNLRRNMKRQRNKLKGENIETRLEVVVDKEGVKSSIDEYGVIEAAGWKSDKGTAIHSSNAQGKFYTALMECYCAKGCGVIYKYYFNKHLVAVDLCVKNTETIIILKTTYDETRNDVSPALLMKEESFRSIFDAGNLKVIEFYGRVMDWHTKWSNEIRVIFHLEVLRWPVFRLLKK